MSHSSWTTRLHVKRRQDPMADESSGFTPAQATQAQRDDGGAVGAGPDAGILAAKAAVAAPAQVDVQALLTRLQALEAKVEAAGVTGEHPLIGTALAARQQLGVHVDHNALAGDPAHQAALRLADDLVDASRNAVESGDVSAARDIAARLSRALRRIHPGPGDNHYFRQAAEMISDHYQDAADTVTVPAPAAAAVTSSQPAARVVAGSVTG